MSSWSIILLLYLLLATSNAFMFGPSSVVEPMSIYDPRFVTIVDAPSQQAILADPTFITILTAVPNTLIDDTIFYTRPIPSINGQPMESSGVVYDLDREIAWLLNSDNSVHGLSLCNWTIVQSFTMPEGWMEFWSMGVHASGQWFPLLFLSDKVTWLLPNGTLASIATPALDTHILVDGSQLFFVSFTSKNVTAWHVDLESGDVRSLMQTNPYVTAPTYCSIQLNASTVAFLLLLNDSYMALAVLDTLSLSITFVLISATADAIPPSGKQVQCKPSIYAAVFYVWPTTSHLANSFPYYVVNISAATFETRNLLGEWHSIAAVDFTADGGAVLVVTDMLTALQVLWLTSKYSSIELQSRSLEYVSSVTLGNTSFIQARTTDYIGPSAGVLIVNLHPSPQVVAWIGLDFVFVDKSMAVDPDTSALYLFDGFVVSNTAHLYVFDWRSPTSIRSLVQRYDIGIIGSTNFGTVSSILAVNGGVYMAINAAPTLGLNMSILHGEIGPTFSLTVATSLDTRDGNLVLAPDGTIYMPSLEGVAQLNASGQVLRWVHTSDWTIDAVVGSTFSEDNNTLYVVRVSPNTAYCTQIALNHAALNSTMITANVSLNGGLQSEWAPSVMIADGNLYATLMATTAHMLKFTLACEFVAQYDTMVTYTYSFGAIIPYQDQFLVARYPFLSGVYVDCGFGRFRNITSGECAPCPGESVSAVADTQACSACPARTTPDVLHITCLCSEGFYSAANNEDCDVCPQGGECLGSNQLQPAVGYWRANPSSSKFYACPLGERSCNGSDVCAKGYKGPLCAVCESHHAMVMSECRECSAAGAAAGFWLAAVVVYVCAFIVLLYSGSSMSVLKSLISFAQIVTFPASGPMPRLLRSKIEVITHLFSLANFQLLSILSVDCLLQRHVSFPASAVAEALVPLIFIIIVAILIMTWRRLFAMICNRGNTTKNSITSSDPFNESPSSFGDRLQVYARSGTPLRVILFVVLLSTPAVTQKLASFFTCEKVASKEYLVRDYTVECRAHEWIAFAAPVSFLLCIYALGVPLALFILLYRYRDKLDVRFLHSAYKDEYYWWDCTEQLRKLILLLLNAVVAPRAPSFYGPSSLSVSIIALSMHLSVAPYKRTRDKWFQTADLAGICLFFMWSVTSPADDAEDVLAWVYWIYAVCYALTSIAVLLQPLFQKAIACLWRKRSTNNSVEDSSELDSLMLPRTK